jgi:hypothetical protein
MHRKSFAPVALVADGLQQSLDFTIYDCVGKEESEC